MKLCIKEIKSGDVTEFEYYPITNRGFRRDGKSRISRQTQIRLNFKNSIKRLCRLINTNFISGDLLLTLQYNENRPNSERKVLRDVQNFIRRIRRYQKKNRLPQLKYIYVIEVTKSNNWHCHMIMSNVDKKIVRKLWRYSDRVWIKNFEPSRYLGGDAWAKYLMGRKGNKDFKKGSWRSWNSSKNLQKPIEKIYDCPYSRAEVARIANEKIDDGSFWEKLCKGYRFVNAESFFNDYNCWWYLYVKMYKQNRNMYQNKPPE